MKALVVFYSRTGATKKVGEAIANELKCDVEEVVDAKDRRGVLGYITGGRDAMSKKLTKIDECKRDLSAYDLVIVGTPIWGWNMTPAIRTYLTQNKDKLRKVAYYCTYGGSGGENAYEEMEKVCGIKPIATLGLTTKEAMSVQPSEKIKQYAAKLVG